MTKTTIFKTILLIFLFTVLKAVSSQNAVLAITNDPQLLPEKETIQKKNQTAKEEYVRLFPNDGNCVYPGKGLLRKWPEGGPHELWRLKIGEGKAAIIESGGKAFTAYQAEGKQWAACLDPATGNIIWKKMLIAVENHHVVAGTVSTPIVDGDRVYFFPYDSDKGNYWYPQCPIFCLNVTDGATIWEEHEQFNASEGGLPLILGNVMYIGSSGKTSVLEAVDKLTGKLLWKIGHDSGENYCFQTGSSLSYAEFGGVPQIICCIYKDDYIGVHATTGEILWHWSFPSAPPASGPVPTPVVLGNRMFVSTFQGNSSWGALLEFSMKNGKLSADTIYISDKLMCNGFHTPSVTEGAVYGFGRGNSGDALQCLDLKSGKLLWQQENQEWGRNGNMIVADGLIFALTKRDELVLIEAGKNGYQELGRVNPGIKLGIQQQPTLFNGRLYLKGNDTIVCYQVE